MQNKLDFADECRQDNEETYSRQNEILSVIQADDFTIADYNDSLVRLLIEKITVQSEDKLIISFKEFGEIEVNISNS